MSTCIVHAGTHRSTDCARGHQVSWSDITAVDRVMGELLLHGPVHVLVTEKSKHEDNVPLHYGSQFLNANNL